MQLASLPTVSLVETSGVRNYEISIEVPLNRLRALGLTLDDIAAAVGRSSLDLSAGSIDTPNSQVRVRTLGATLRPAGISRISSCSDAATARSCVWAISPRCGTIFRMWT